MSKKISGTTFIKDGCKFDYCFVESIKSLQEFCDEVIICNVISNDGTTEILKQLENGKTKVIYREPDEWDSLKALGKERLNYFSNLAFDQISNEWNYYQQADEIIIDNSRYYIMEAINSEISSSYFVHRINLWATPNTMLKVPQSRMPCSEIIVRLAKSKYRTYGDAESIAVDEVSDAYMNKIKMVHYGFVRNAAKMKHKAISMQEEVFQMGGHDVKLDNCEAFISERWFSGSDLIEFNEHPKIMMEWIKTRP